jgi:O-antigen ligase
MYAVVFLLMGLALFDASYGFVQAFGGDYKIWWYRRGQDSITGTFINRNHFAGFMMAVILLSLGYAVGSWLTAYQKVGGRRRMRRWKDKILLLSESKGELMKIFLIFFLCVIMSVALVFSQSRGGIVCLMAALSLFGALYALKQGRRYVGRILLAFIILAAAYSLYIGLDPVLERFNKLGVGQSDRILNMSRIMEMIGDYSATGVGVGNFHPAILKYEAWNEFNKLMVYAHNDWAQWLAEAGVVGLAILLVGLLWFFYDVFRRWLKQSNPMAVSLGLGMIAALFGVALHAFMDFDLHMPAIPITLAAVVAVGYASIHMGAGRDPFSGVIYKGQLKPKIFYGTAIFIFCVAFWGLWTSVRHFAAEVHCATELNETLNLVENPSAESIMQAISWDGANAGYRYKMAKELIRQRAEWKRTNALGGDEARYTEDQAKEDRRRTLEIIAVLEDASRLNPFDAEYHHRLGWFYTYLWREPDYHTKWLPAADIAMERAGYFAGETNSRMYVDLGHYWVMRSRSLDRTHPMQDSAWARACWHYRKARELDDAKAVVEEITRYVQTFYPGNPERLQEALQ